jgi:hypothetical protein
MKRQGERYRCLARGCLAVAKTMPEGKDRTIVLEMAAVWHRLANEYAGATMLLFEPTQSEQPAMQQQTADSAAERQEGLNAPALGIGTLIPKLGKVQSRESSRQRVANTVANISGAAP